MSVLYPVHINDSSLQQIQRPLLTVRQKSPENIKQQLITKIKALANKNTQLEIRQQNLQNTIYDLKKLIELTNRESDQMLSYIHKKVKQLESKRDRYNAGLYYGQKNDKHFQKCMLFWNQFM